MACWSSPIPQSIGSRHRCHQGRIGVVSDKHLVIEGPSPLTLTSNQKSICRGTRSSLMKTLQSPSWPCLGLRNQRSLCRSFSRSHSLVTLVFRSKLRPIFPHHSFTHHHHHRGHHLANESRSPFQHL